MIQIVAALFFAAALLVPLAVVTLTLQSNWRAIVRALGGVTTDDRLPYPRQRRVRPAGPAATVRRSHGKRVAA